MKFKAKFTAGLSGTEEEIELECDTEEEAWEEAEEACLQHLERYGIEVGYDDEEETYLDSDGNEFELDYYVEEILG